MHCEDLTLILNDGEYNCNSFLCASIFPIIGDLLEESSEEQIVISLPEFKTQEFSNFFTSIYAQKPELEVSDNIQYLLKHPTNCQELDYEEMKNVRSVLYKEYAEIEDEDIDTKETFHGPVKIEAKKVAPKWVA